MIEFLNRVIQSGSLPDGPDAPTFQSDIAVDYDFKKNVPAGVTPYCLEKYWNLWATWHDLPILLVSTIIAVGIFSRRSVLLAQ